MLRGVFLLLGMKFIPGIGFCELAHLLLAEIKAFYSVFIDRDEKISLGGNFEYHMET